MKNGPPTHRLPGTHEDAHALAFLFHDLVLRAWIDARNHEVFSVKVPLESEDERRNFDSYDGDAMAWLWGVQLTG